MIEFLSTLAVGVFTLWATFFTPIRFNGKLLQHWYSRLFAATFAVVVVGVVFVCLGFLGKCLLLPYKLLLEVFL